MKNSCDVRRATGLLAALLVAACGGKELAVESLRLPDESAGVQRADPALAVDPATGDLLMTWTAGDSSAFGIYFARSGDGGSSWSAPATVAAPARDIRPHAESAPRLVATGAGVVAVVWSNSIAAPGRRWPASNIRFARSTDGGRTWSAPLTLNDDSSGTPGGHLFHGAAWQGDSALVVTWMDERQGRSTVRPPARPAPEVVGHEHSQADAEPDARIWMARSSDLGASWAANTPLWTEACPCCRVSLARGPGGTVTAGWRRHYPGNVRDVVVAPLVGSDSLPEPRRVHPDQWVYPGCPHTGPGIALDSGGRSHVAWFSGKQGAAGVYYAREEAAGGRQFTAPLALVQARTLPASHAVVSPRAGGGAWVAWDIAADGRRIASVAVIDDAGNLVRQLPLDTLEGADHPQLVVLRDGAAVVAWARGGTQPAVRLVRIKEPS